MDDEDREAANAALLLDEKINDRIWQVFEENGWRFDQYVLDAISRNKRDPRLAMTVTDLVKEKL